MSKIKVGDNVIVKESNLQGVVKSREIILNDKDFPKIEYVVKLGDGFEHWGSYTRKELKRNNKPLEVKPKKYPFYHLKTAWNGYIVITVGILKDFSNFGFYRLTVGHAICNPNDEFELEKGIKIASRRAKKQWFSRLLSNNRRDFTKETIEAIIKTKCEYIANNIQNFVN